MTDRNPQKVVDRLYEFADYGLDNTCILLFLDELIHQFGYTHLYLDGDHGIGVVNVKDIQKVMETIRELNEYND
jgi:hypothetical protein